MRTDRFHTWLPLFIVVALAAASCVQLYAIHRDHYRDHWVGVTHDRNAHYRYGLMIAADVKNGDAARFFKDFDAGSWVWPPLNGMALCAVFLAAGSSPVVAAVPALAGWFLAAVFAYLLANRVSSRYSMLAGLLASACVIASPAHRAFATEVMLESTGAGLTLVALHAFVVWSQSRSQGATRWLGVALTLLFLQKYNYWLLVVMAVLPVHLFEHRVEYVAFLRRLRSEVPWRTWLLGQFRRPLNYPIAILLGIILAIKLTGGFTLQFQGKPLEVRSDLTFVTIAYALVLLRITIWWWSGGRQIARNWLLPHVYPLLEWHVFPVLAWLAIPHRFRTFLWFLSPTNTLTEYRPSFMEGVRFYWEAAQGEYAPVPEVAVALGVGAILAVLLMFVPRVFRAGGMVVPVFAVLSVFLAVKHPNHQPRFLHTAMAGVFVAAAVGYAGLCSLLSRGSNKFVPWACMLALVAALGGLVYVATPVLKGSGHASGPSLETGGKSLRTVTDAVEPLITEGEPTAIFSNVPSKFWATWLFLERIPRHDLLQVDCREVGVYTSPTAEEFGRWCAETKTQQVIFIKIAEDSPIFEAASPDGTTASVIDLLPGSPFKLVQTQPLKGYGTITVWQK